MSAASQAAQIEVDFGKITCRQYLFDPNFIPKERMITDWMSGYINGKNDNTMVDMAANKDEDYCRLNLDKTLIVAAQSAPGLAK